MRKRIGYRGAFLITVGAYDLFYGLFLALLGPIEHEPLLPERTWGIIWMTTGFLLLIGAFTRHDAPFYTLAILIKMVWALEFLHLDLYQHIPDDWIRCCYWLAFAATIGVAAVWPEHIKIISPPSPEPGKAEQRARGA